MSRHGDFRANTLTVRAEPVIRGIMLRIATIGLTALDQWSTSDIPNEDQREVGRDVFKCILDTLAWEAQKRQWECMGPEESKNSGDVSRETDEDEES